MLTTASITFSATSAMPSGPRASAGTERTGADTRTPAAPRQIAASIGTQAMAQGWNRTGHISSLSSQIGTEFEVHSAPERGCGASI